MEPNRATGEDAPARQEGNATATETEASDADNDSQRTLACRDCNSTNIRRIQGATGVGRRPTADGPYACNDCGWDGEPVAREKQIGNDEGLVTACPHCDSSNLNRRKRADYDPDERYLCKDCRRTFAEPVMREPASGGNYSAAGEALLEADPDDLIADGSGHVCEACDEQFQTLTALRLHEKDECQARATFGQVEPGAPDAGLQAAEGLLTCRECGRENPDADYDQTASYDGDDYHLIAEWTCRHCEFENENRVVMEGVSREKLAELPPHLQPDDTDLVTDGGENELSRGGDA